MRSLADNGERKESVSRKKEHSAYKMSKIWELRTRLRGRFDKIKTEVEGRGDGEKQGNVVVYAVVRQSITYEPIRLIALLLLNLIIINLFELN